MALQSEGRFRRTENLPRENNFALQAFARLEWFSDDAIESFTAEIFRGALGWRHSRLPKQTHWPMQCYPLASAAITG
jgi:hypothetical protein